MAIEYFDIRGYKAVLFDMGGVLIQYRERDAYERLLMGARRNWEMARALKNFDLGIGLACIHRLVFIIRSLPTQESSQSRNSAHCSEN